MGYHDDNGVYRDLSESFGLTVAKLKTIDVSDHQQGERVQLADPRNSNFYYYDATSELAGDDLIVIAPAEGPGRYLLAPGYDFDLALPIAFGDADAAALVTTPDTAFLARLGRSYWEVTADWTGGSSSTIGISTDTAPDDTQGDLLGGAAGDVAATLVAAGGNLLGTIGAKVAGGILLKGDVVVRYDEITSAFTAGAGFAHLVGTMIRNPGA
jgi:hypothetical protein